MYILVEKEKKESENPKSREIAKNLSKTWKKRGRNQDLGRHHRIYDYHYPSPMKQRGSLKFDSGELKAHIIHNIIKPEMKDSTMTDSDLMKKINSISRGKGTEYNWDRKTGGVEFHDHPTPSDPNQEYGKRGSKELPKRKPLKK